MSLVTKSMALMAKDASDNTILYLPYTSIDCVEGGVKSVNGVSADSSGNVTLDLSAYNYDDEITALNNKTSAITNSTETSLNVGLVEIVKSSGINYADRFMLGTVGDSGGTWLKSLQIGYPKANAKYAVTSINGALANASGELTLDIPEVPVNVSAFMNDAGYLTAIPDEYITDTELAAFNYAAKSDLPTKTSQLINDSGFLTEIDAIYVNAINKNTSDITALKEKTSLISLSGSSTLKITGNATVTGAVTATQFNGSLNGNAASATKATQDDAGNPISTTYVRTVNGQAPTNGNVALSIPTVPTNISAFTNDAGYLTAIPEGYVTESTLEAKNYATKEDISAILRILDWLLDPDGSSQQS